MPLEPMTDDEIQVARVIANDATPGPWTAHWDGGQDGDSSVGLQRQGPFIALETSVGLFDFAIDLNADTDVWAGAIRDVEFISRARDDVPRLIARVEVERLKVEFITGELDRLKKAVAHDVPILTSAVEVLAGAENRAHAAQDKLARILAEAPCACFVIPPEGGTLRECRILPGGHTEEIDGHVYQRPAWLDFAIAEPQKKVAS